MSGNLKLLFLTTHNLATNPRVYKEILLAKAAGFHVQVICFTFKNWSKELNDHLLKGLTDVKIICIPAGRKPLRSWLFSIATETMCRLFGKYIPVPLPVLAQAVSRRNCLLIKALNKVEPPHWVIGHNPGTLYATRVAGKKFGCKTGFDVEDYHPGEGNNRQLQALSRRLMECTLPSMHYVSFASLLIKKEVEEEIKVSGKNWFTLMNFFPAGEFREQKERIIGPLKLVWFSQNISFDRGLEWIIPIVRSYVGKMELHLIGKLDNEFFQKELQDLSNVVIHPPMPQQNLHHSLTCFDIGLAVEPAKDRNNELAVSNKILAYLQAGLYVVATDTNAQRRLLHTFPGHGTLVDLQQKNVQSVFEKVLDELEDIRERRQRRFQNFTTENWEKAAEKLLATWTNS